MGTRHATAKRNTITADLGGMICGHCGRQASGTPVSCSFQEAFPSSRVDRTEKLHGICHATQFWHVQNGIMLPGFEANEHWYR